MPTDRRRSPRVQILGELLGQSLVLDDPIEIKDISTGGFLAHTRVNLPINSTHEFQLTWEAETCQVHARVLHSRIIALEDGLEFAIGVEFMNLTPQQLASLQGFIGRLTATIVE